MAAPVPGGIHNMFRVRLYAAHLGGFLVQNSRNKGPFSPDISYTWVGLVDIGGKLFHMCSFSTKFVIKMGPKASFGN